MPAHTLVCFLYSKPENIEKVKAKLQEASQVSITPETLDYKRVDLTLIAGLQQGQRYIGLVRTTHS